MRNLNEENHQSDDETDFCDCCGGEFDHRDLLKVYAIAPDGKVMADVKEIQVAGGITLPAEIRICEDCQQDADDDFMKGDDTVPIEKWQEFIEWSYLQHVLAFIPAEEQLCDEHDVREFCAALTKILIWHPETSFDQYENQHTGKRIFSDEDAKELDKCIERCEEVCERLSKGNVCDFYEIGFQELAKHNETMAAAMGRDHKTGLSLPDETAPSPEPGGKAGEFKAWLWPDKTIGKKESRQLREEHNKLVNAYERLRQEKYMRDQMREAFHNAFIDESHDGLIRRLLAFYDKMPTAELENRFYQMFTGNIEHPGTRRDQ